MPHKKLIGKTETITYEEADALRDKALTEFVYYMCTMIDDNTLDEEERANAKTNMSSKLGNLMSLCELKGLLMDPDYYIAGLPHSEGTRIEEGS